MLKNNKHYNIDHQLAEATSTRGTKHMLYARVKKDEAYQFISIVEQREQQLKNYTNYWNSLTKEQRQQLE